MWQYYERLITFLPDTGLLDDLFSYCDVNLCFCPKLALKYKRAPRTSLALMTTVLDPVWLVLEEHMQTDFLFHIWGKIFLMS